MSSLKLLMQNYSDSEDESSDEERRRKRSKRKSRDESVNLEEKNLEQIEESSEPKNDDESDHKRDEELKLKKDAESSDSEKNEDYDLESRLSLKMQDNARMVYLEDDFFTLGSDERDEEMNDNSNTSIIDDDDDEENHANRIDKVNIETDASSQNNNEDLADKLSSSRYSPKSFHRLLVGLDEQNIQIPDAPVEQCSDELTQKVINYHNKMKQGIDMNKSIQCMKSFRNPSIYEKLISFCNIDEFGTNLPSEIFDPDLFREKESHHDTSI